MNSTGTDNETAGREYQTPDPNTCDHTVGVVEREGHRTEVVYQSELPARRDEITKWQKYCAECRAQLCAGEVVTE